MLPLLSVGGDFSINHIQQIGERITMHKWSKPRYQNLRYGFEINLYVKVR
ncbi:MAG: coenzyme PQQ precursor peptide PqqA [gamma proteobacterium symbiont of Ctena orbiculata]|nr:MAG: coenzyme PQQ precursor peptide PqqA [gamma proteobacterium symbiont of Ctena orbiculata]PVV17218.1 MAG: coenzyme PQQ precursor peptide PqqA [gamma proteobacterium symbiont of Ctena orbiculata]PVV19005.1 MAG: coenzyme PQQ precursor peptide PqqA [gamma proteobacterium symbiont of Ctena orbiculata]